MSYRSASIRAGHAPIHPSQVQWVEHDATGLIYSVAREVNRRLEFITEYGTSHPLAKYHLTPLTLCVMDKDAGIEQDEAWSVIDTYGYEANVAVRAIDRRPFDVWLKKMRFGLEDLSFKEIEQRLSEARIEWSALKEDRPFHQRDCDQAEELVEKLKQLRRVKGAEKLAMYSVVAPASDE